MPGIQNRAGFEKGGVLAPLLGRDETRNVSFLCLPLLYLGLTCVACLCIIVTNVWNLLILAHQWLASLAVYAS